MPLYAAVVVEGHQEPSHEDNDAAIFITESKPTDIREPNFSQYYIEALIIMPTATN